jgi:hypothetical protein
VGNVGFHGSVVVECSKFGVSPLGQLSNHLSILHCVLLGLFVFTLHIYCKIFLTSNVI